MTTRILTVLIMMLMPLSYIRAQSNSIEYKAVDEFVKRLGRLENENVATIADTLTRKLVDKEQKARAIFYWIANNIALDPKAIKTNDEGKNLPETVVKLRKATPLGFAKLFQEMSSIANIRCLVVDGFVKNNPEDINNPAEEINHSWNVVQLGKSPQQWYFIDVAKASGTLDKKITTFTSDFTSELFFANKTLFNLDHYPDNDAWQLGGGPTSLKEFYSLPLYHHAAYLFGLKKPLPMTGFIKTKKNTKVNFILPFGSDSTMYNVSLLIGDEKKQKKPEPMNFTSIGGEIKFSYEFKLEDVYPVKIMFDGKIVLEYMVEVAE